MWRMRSCWASGSSWKRFTIDAFYLPFSPAGRRCPTGQMRGSPAKPEHKEDLAPSARALIRPSATFSLRGRRGKRDEILGFFNGINGNHFFSSIRFFPDVKSSRSTLGYTGQRCRRGGAGACRGCCNAGGPDEGPQRMASLRRHDAAPKGCRDRFGRACGAHMVAVQLFPRENGEGRRRQAQRGRSCG
jgi:hypothetical protein